MVCLLKSRAGFIPAEEEIAPTRRPALLAG
jgi:hypothetical protein